jgi:hypothetical protein
MVGLLLTFPMQSGATPTCGVNDEGQTTCVVNVIGRGSLTDYYPIDVLPPILAGGDNFACITYIHFLDFSSPDSVYVFWLSISFDISRDS